jgi:hypothetical protein
MTLGGKVYYSKPEFHVIHYTLAPGAPLKKFVEDYDNLIVGLGDGELANEMKSPASHVKLFKGAVVMMQKGQDYLLRNVGDNDVDLLVIDLRN